MTSDNDNRVPRTRDVARARPPSPDDPGSVECVVGVRRWARRDAERIRMDIGEAFFQRHAQYIRNTATFGSAAPRADAGADSGPIRATDDAVPRPHRS